MCLGACDGGDCPNHIQNTLPRPLLFSGTVESRSLCEALAGCLGLWPSKIEPWMIDPEFDRAEKEGFQLGRDPMNARTATQTLMP